MKFAPMRHVTQILIALSMITLLIVTPAGRIAALTMQQPASTPAAELDAEFVGDWVQLLYARVQADKLSAPAGSRIYGYTSVALWEAVLPGMPGRNSMAGQLNEMPDMPVLPDDTAVYDWATTANAALSTVASDLMPTKTSIEAFQALRKTQIADRSKTLDAAVIKRSVEYGDLVGKAILDWAHTDHYDELKDKPYDLPTGDVSTYVLTTPGTKPAEPYWGQLRAFAMNYNELCNVQQTMDFSADPKSNFYAQAMEVKQTRDNLTPEQKAAADFWVDTAGITGTPSGHWMMIGKQLITLYKMKLDFAAGMFVMIGVASADSFISCWGLKYNVLLLRPETYIKKYIRRGWAPYIQTPPFPEYPSGHSVVSAAVAEVLTSYMGAVAFTDNTHAARNLPPRSFTSFEAAASEAAISRLYGGIHFREAIENGMRQGRCVGRNIIDKIQLQPKGNG